MKSKEEIALLREGGKRLAAIRDGLASRAKPGVSAMDIEIAAAELFAASGGEPSFFNHCVRKGEPLFPARVCVSRNDAIVHGVPRHDIVFCEGDVVGIDVGLKYRGLFTDTAVTVPVGRVSKKARKLLDITEKALHAGIEAARPGASTGDVGHAIEQFVQARGGFGIVRTLCGHGVGYAVHEEPQVPNFGRKGEGTLLQAGMVIAIEPMLTLGGETIILDDDGFTFKTKDGSLAAHFEHTVAVTREGVEVLTASSRGS